MAEHRDNLHMVPEHMREAICLWIERAEPQPERLGRFLRAVLSNDLRGAVLYGDEANVQALLSWVRFLWNYAPGPCWGSSDALTQWYHAHHPQEKQ